MAGAELLTEAIAELYAADPDTFTERRGVLAAQARAAGAAPVAKTIAALRKPTRSAWIINQLVRADPRVPAQLAALGDELRAAETALDGAKIRELSLARRQLIDALVRRALAAADQSPPPAALREEMTATFGAALADPQVAEQLAAGTLLRVERRAGFGSGMASELVFVSRPTSRRPSLAVVAEPAAPARAAARTAAAAAPAAASAAAAAELAETGAAEAAAAKAAAAEAAAAKAAAAARASAERERRRAIADAERAVTRASQAADAAATVERERESAVQRIEEQLADARRRLHDARLQARQANSAQRTARQKLDRLRE